MEKQRMKREKRTKTNEGDEREISGEKGIIKYYYFFYGTATMQFYLQNCTILQKNLEYLSFEFSDTGHFGAANAKFSLHLAFAFPNANALRLLEDQLWY